MSKGAACCPNLARKVQQPHEGQQVHADELPVRKHSVDVGVCPVEALVQTLDQTLAIVEPVVPFRHTWEGTCMCGAEGLVCGGPVNRPRSVQEFLLRCRVQIRIEGLNSQPVGRCSPEGSLVQLAEQHARDRA